MLLKVGGSKALEYTEGRSLAQNSREITSSLYCLCQVTVALRNESKSECSAKLEKEELAGGTLALLF